MGYELSATMTNGTDTQTFTVAPGRTSLSYILDEIAKVYPDSLQDDPNSHYRIATLSAEQAGQLFADWHEDLGAFTEEDDDGLPTFDGVVSGMFGENLEGGHQDVLKMQLAEMLGLALDGYTATFTPE